jgi:hypothetical protein
MRHDCTTFGKQSAQQTTQSISRSLSLRDVSHCALRTHLLVKPSRGHDATTGDHQLEQSPIGISGLSEIKKYKKQQRTFQRKPNLFSDVHLVCELRM